MSTNWPLLSPAFPAKAGQPNSRPSTARSRPGTMATIATIATTTTTITAAPFPPGDMKIPPRTRRLTGPAKDASEDYHDFIGAVEKSTKRAMFTEQKRKRRRAQHLPVGTTRLFDHGRMRLVPFPSANPKDPLNLPEWRKWAAVVSMSMFGALAVATEVANGNLLEPIFALQYAGANPNAIQNASFTLSTNSASVNLTSALDPLLPTGTSLLPAGQLNMLSTIPLLTAAAASYVQVPLSVAVGRRPVLLLASLCAWIGALWASLSSNNFDPSSAASMSSAFQQHLGARALVGLGSGAVNALIPLVAAHDLFFLHQRHIVLAVVFAIQAVVTAGLSASAPVLATFFDWRWLYYIVGTAGFLAWLALVAFVPETRWTLRTKTQLCGGGCGGDADQCVYAADSTMNNSDVLHARLDHEAYGGRTLWTDMGIFVVSPFGAWEWSRAGSCVLDLARTLLLPAVVWVALIQTILFVAFQAATQLTVTAMLTASTASTDAFARSGLALGVSLGSAGVLTVVLGGYVSGRFTLGVTRHLRAQQNRRMSMLDPAARRAMKKTRPTVRREAEHNLPVMVLPLALAIAGSFLFGVVLYYAMEASDSTITTHSSHMWVMLLAATSLLALAMLLAVVAGSVYLIESYPVWAGPCLVHANSLRFVAAFFLSGKTAELVSSKGALESWAVYAEVLIVASLGLPALFFSGRWLRAWAAGTVQGGGVEEVAPEEKRTGDRATMISPAPSDTSTSMSISTTTTTTMTSSSVFDQAPHPGTRADIPFDQESVKDESAITGRAL
ncbi:hypothetical protein SEUCBS139899_008974 [Sporothrix eucalyptigena]|uniref:Major facilitator superfamily transporter n=1 Tax=Sporothrix eucalyptigena TaxID=1812306 RepID=A0ABP0C298_9PEZI